MCANLWAWQGHVRPPPVPSACPEGGQDPGHARYHSQSPKHGRPVVWSALAGRRRRRRRKNRSRRRKRRRGRRVGKEEKGEGGARGRREMP